MERITGGSGRNWLVPAVFLLTLISVLAPIATALLIARHQSFVAGRERAMRLATEAVERANLVGRQMRSARRELERLPLPAPCSAAARQRMASVALEYEQLQGVGYVRDDRLICTSAGLQHPPLPLGPPRFYTVEGYAVRPDVNLPVAPRTRLIMISAQTGYTFLAHPRLSLDMPLASKREAIGVIGFSHPMLINARGPVDTRLLAPFFRTGQTSYVRHNRLIAVSRSHESDVAAFVMVPMDEVQHDTGRYLLYLLPIGLLCGGVVIVLLNILVRTENSLATIARRAFKTDQFYLCYQPIVELTTGRWIGAEALVRWRRPTGEEMRPDLFIPYLEEAGLITRLTDKVFDLLAADIGRDLAERENFYLSINAAAVDLRCGRLMELLETLMSRTGCGARKFAIEATERGLIDAEEGRQALGAARERGIRVALDDFGTGYSSLAYLQAFPLDYIKIDRSFVDSIATEAAISSVVVHIINMAQDLKLGLIAEGVETEEQARFLAARGVAYGQGWLFARPMRWAELMAGLDRQGQPG